MSTTIRIVSAHDDTFAKVRIRRTKGFEEEVYRCPQWDSLTCHDRDAGVRRLRPGMGHVLNEGPHPVRLVYEYKGERVGPTTDYLLPGSYKELGIGPGVTWWFREA